DALLCKKHIDEAQQPAAVVEQTVSKAGMGRIEGLEDLGDSAFVGTDLVTAASERPQLTGNAHGNSHRHAPSGMSTAATKASSVGAMVAVGVQSGATASRVFNPWPVI